MGGLNKAVRTEVRKRNAQAWHLVNLPAGADVQRLLRRQVGELDREAGCSPWSCRNGSARRWAAMLNTIDRVRREVERNALRARNGVRMATGIQRTDVGLSAKDVVWSHGRTELWHYRSDQVRDRSGQLQDLIMLACLAEQTFEALSAVGMADVAGGE